MDQTAGWFALLDGHVYGVDDEFGAHCHFDGCSLCGPGLASRVLAVVCGVGMDVCGGDVGDWDFDGVFGVCGSDEDVGVLFPSSETGIDALAVGGCDGDVFTDEAAEDVAELAGECDLFV